FHLSFAASTCSYQPLGVMRSILPSPLTSPHPSPCPAPSLPTTCSTHSGCFPALCSSYQTTWPPQFGRTQREFLPRIGAITLVSALPGLAIRWRGQRSLLSPMFSCQKISPLS